MKKYYFIFLFFSLSFLVQNSVRAQIITNSIHHQIIGQGQYSLDLNIDNSADYRFEIITLSPGVLAARVISLNGSFVLDNSTYGYADALDFGDSIKGYFHANTIVLGTINSAGNFSGKGNKYLGLHILSNQGQFTA